MERSRFSYRALTSLILVWAFLTLMVSGIMLYVSPPGRIANWSDWRLLGLTKEQWQGVHTLTAIVFLTGGLFHLLKFNWKVFVAYAKGRAGREWHYRREFAASVILVLVVLAGTIIQVPPFQSVMAGGEVIKNSWADTTNQPPVPHMEEMTIQEVAGKLELPPDRAVGIVKEQGVAAAQPQMSLKEAARETKKSPQEIYRELQHKSALPPEKHPQAGFGHGMGLGRKSVTDAAAELGVTPEAVIAALAARNIKAKPEDTMRAIASANGMTPAEIFEILQKVSREKGGQ